MNTKRDSAATASAVDSCPTERLAGSEFVVVDRCSCGTLRVHLGALTLRVTAEGLMAIMQTLGEALVKNARIQAPHHKLMSMSAMAGKAPRGES